MIPVASTRAHLLMSLNILIIAGAIIASEELSNVANSYSLTLLRFIAASILLAPVVLLVKSKRARLIKIFPKSFVISFFYCAFFVGFFEALETTNSLNTGAIFTLVPLITAILSMLFLKQSLNSKLLVFYLTGVVTASWIVFKGNIALFLAADVSEGDIIFLIATISFCCFTLSMKLLYRGEDMASVVFCTLVGGAIWMMLAKVVFAYPLHWHEVQGKYVYYMAYLVVAATLFTVYLFQRVTVILGPVRVNAYFYIIPALVALMAVAHSSRTLPGHLLPAIILSFLISLAIQLMVARD